MKGLILAALSCLSLSVLATPPSSSEGALCCSKLKHEFLNITFVNAGNQSLQYDSLLQSYFNLPDALPPSCFIQPETTQQISRIITIFSQSQCQFAVKAGGHMLYIGSNAIENGVTIDLRQIHQTTLSADKKTVSVGPGAKWGEVYQYLDNLGAAIPGGRASDVGVAGLTLGGGNSFYASRYGLVCDNVKNFEVVLGNGSITDANANQNPDLFKGLKGGSGNLGLVTRFDFVAFPSGPLWGGITAYEYSDLHKFFAPIVDFTNNIEADPYGSLITFWGHNATTNTTIVSNLYEYTGNATAQPYYQHTDPIPTNTTSTAANPFPSTFSNFTFDKIGTPLQNDLRVTSLYNLTADLNTAPGVRNIYASLHFKATLPILTQVNQIIQETFEATYADPQYEFVLAEYQPLPRVFTDHSIEKGGNVLGLDKVKDNGIMLMLLIIWQDPKQDQAARQLMDSVMSNVTTYTQKVGAYRPWLYVNYAMEDEDPIGSYGADNVEFLKTVSRKYDAGQTFQKLAPGGWKLGNAGTRKKEFNFNHFEKFKPEDAAPVTTK